MELWIRSQDKERLLKLNDIFVNANYCVENGEIYGYRIFANGELYLGTYNTKERCIEILGEIQKAIENEGIKKEEYEYTSGCYLTIMKKVYEMPKE